MSVVSDLQTVQSALTASYILYETTGRSLSDTQIQQITDNVPEHFIGLGVLENLLREAGQADIDEQIDAFLSDMNAFQMWQWTDWFLSNRVRSLLGTIRDYEQLEPDVPLYAQAEEDQWQLRETENILSRFEAQLEEDRLAILNGIRQYQSDGTSDAERLTVCKRILEAESEIRQIIEIHTDTAKHGF